jgi:hypothetical protein
MAKPTANPAVQKNIIWKRFWGLRSSMRKTNSRIQAWIAERSGGAYALCGMDVDL